MIIPIYFCIISHIIRHNVWYSHVKNGKKAPENLLNIFMLDRNACNRSFKENFKEELRSLRKIEVQKRNTKNETLE